MISNIKAFAKFLDQPILISKLDKSMPKIMAAGASLIFLKQGHDIFHKEENKDKAKKIVLKKGIVLTGAVMSALLAPKIASRIFNRTPIEPLEKIRAKNEKLTDEFIKTTKPDIETLEILNKAKKTPLSFKNLKKLFQKYDNSAEGRQFLDELIPDPQNISAKDIFSEISYLSVYGAIPVVGGIMGGIGAEIAVGNNYKEKIPDKINEGIYQYLANIFMCNIGAGAALGILEKMGITSKSARAAGMGAGIALTGVLGGSKAANFIARKIISPVISPNKKIRERKPELADIGLHTDDIATVSLLSGLKWIEPSLPILYSVSGYKAGIGYRN